MATREARVDAAVEESTRLRLRIDDLQRQHAAADERLHGQVLEARQIAHAAKGELQAAVGTLELIRAEGSLPTPHLREIGEAIDGLGRVAGLFDRLHAMIRGMEPGL